MGRVLAFLSGALFGAGLLVAGMTLPARVRGFFDVTGAWDPTLAFVMGGALATYAVAYRLLLRRRAPWCETDFRLPPHRRIDRPLLAGAALFGVGWGLAGLCPGPALVTLGTGRAASLVFVATMLVGLRLVAALRA